MDRRQFLRSLFATAVATQLPTLPRADARPLIEQLAASFTGTINGQLPADVTIEALDKGWYRIVARYIDVPSSGFDMDFRSLPGGGLHIGNYDAYGAQVEQYASSAALERSKSGYAFSMYFKPQKETTP